jgi:hypothetical protein
MLIDHKQFFVKEHVAVLKLTDTYDILDPATQQPLGVAKEEPPVWAKYLRLLVNKSLMPTRVNVYEQQNLPPVFSIQVSALRLRINVLGSDGHKLGSFKTKFFSLGGGFWVRDAQDQQVAQVKGDWKGWNFQLLDAQGNELGVITKKWAGIGRELFTSADNYMISLSDVAAANPGNAVLLLAAGLAIDVVLKEKQ